MLLIDTLLVWAADFFKVRNPKIFGMISVGLLALLGLLTEATNKGVVCSDWEKNVIADHYVHVSPGDSINLNTFIADSLVGTWVNDEDGIVFADKGGIATWVFKVTDSPTNEFITVATNSCFINDTTGILAKVMFWLTAVVMALTGVHTTEKKKQILAARNKE